MVGINQPSAISYANLKQRIYYYYYYYYRTLNRDLKRQNEAEVPGYCPYNIDIRNQRPKIDQSQVVS